jgi:hypothetical protein
MSLLRRCLVLVPLLCAGAGLAQQDPAKKEDKAKPTNEVEITLGDGSAIRMTILQESIDVVTRFGKLSVPIAEVRRIELGIHLADGVPEKIAAAMKKLNSSVLKDRDEAVNELTALGPAAYPSLQAAAKTTDPELGQRVQLALKRIRAKHPADALRVLVSDRIITTDFPIVGKIVSPTIKAENHLLGARNFKLGELRTIAWMTGNNEVEVMVDASKYCSRTAWMETSVNIEAGMTLHVLASGEIDLWPGQGNEFISGPQGNFNVGGRGPRQPGTLLGKIGESGTVFNIGERHSSMPTQEGKLYLQVVPGNWGGPGQIAQGSYKVKISAGLHLR